MSATHHVDDVEADQSRTHQPGQPEQPTLRPKALHEANLIHSAFFGRPLPSSLAATAKNDATNAVDASSAKPSPQNERLCMGGHRETIFGISFSPDGKYMASASQDSSICIWDVSSHRLVATLSKELDDKYECLRVAWMKTTDDSKSYGGEKYVLASGGADGIVRLWSSSGEEKANSWQSVGMLDHFLLEKNGGDVSGGTSEEEEERPQIYALQFVRSRAAPNRNILLTTAGDCIYLWNIVENDSPQSQPSDAIKHRKFLPHLSMRFSHLDDGRSTNKFGGARNLANELYIFDASYSESNDFVGAALSDGTCRVSSLVYSENKSFFQEQCVLSLPSDYFPGTRGGHLTALSWDKSGTRLATCLASGRVVLWLLQLVDGGDGTQVLHPSCISVLEGGHDVGRPLFGAKYFGGANQELLISWGVDGKVCVWDSFSVGEVLSPLCTVVSLLNYPIYALDITDDGTKSKAQGNEMHKAHIALGGGADGGFLGVPVYLYGV